MNQKKYIGQLISIKFKYINEEINIRGFVVDYNENWTLLKYNPTDFVCDGYIILNNKYTISFKREENEKFVERVLKLKGIYVSNTDLVPIDRIETILLYLTKHYNVFQFSMRTNTTCWLGKVNKIVGKNLTIDYLNPKGKWEKKMNFLLGNIRTIEYNTDYINSLKLIERIK